jgi:pimeloyl-ACP methyl ester carboxylesterase
VVVFGGAGPPLHLAVGNGFPPEVYLPLVRPLMSDYLVYCLPPRPLWDPPPPPASLSAWTQLADDLLVGLNQQSIAHTIALGHSFGGTISLMAAAHAPERFRALILLDPALFAPDRITAMQRAYTNGVYSNPLAERALKRRSRFGSIEEAVAYWRARPLFEGWPESGLRLYAQSALRPAETGAGFVLRWSPEWEARGYAVAYPDAWPLLAALPEQLPVLVVRGRQSDVFTEAAAAHLETVRPQTTLITLDGGHLFPMTAPVNTARAVLEWLEDTTPQDELSKR